MRTGSEPETNTMPLRAAEEARSSVDSLLEALVERLGGRLAVIEQLDHVLREGNVERITGDVGNVTEETPGYCYLRLLDRVDHKAATEMGAYPTVADVRRFTNSRSDPFGNRTVGVELYGEDGRTRVHVVYRGGKAGLRPVAALAALAKDVRMGGMPDGVTPDFPPSWIPADLSVAQCWDYTMGDKSRRLDCLGWIGDMPSWLDKKYEPISAATSRVRWIVRANPLGPTTDLIDVIDDTGRRMAVRQWVSNVAHTGYHQTWSVRGNKVFVEAYIWRAARVLTDPTAPSPTPTPPSGEHGELGRKLITTRVDKVSGDVKGYCYLNAFKDEALAASALGAYPTVREVTEYAVKLSGRPDPLQGANSSNWAKAAKLCRGSDGVHHVVPGAGGPADFWLNVGSLPVTDLLGATQAEAIIESEHVAEGPVLMLPARGKGMVLTLPFTAKLTAALPYFVWNLGNSAKVNSITDYFESCELESLVIKAIVHKGDADTMLSVVAETGRVGYDNDMGWIGATHALHLSGNSNGATTGELVLAGNHGFGTQLKGTTLGNPTPYIQAKFDSTSGAVAYLRITLVVKVAGSGLPGSVVIQAKSAPGAGAADTGEDGVEVTPRRHRS